MQHFRRLTGEMSAPPGSKIVVNRRKAYRRSNGVPTRTRTWDQRIMSGVRARRPETPGEKQQVRMSPGPLPAIPRKAAIPRFLELLLRSGVRDGSRHLREKLACFLRAGYGPRRPETSGEKQQVRMSLGPFPGRSEVPRKPSMLRFFELLLRSGVREGSRHLGEKLACFLRGQNVMAPFQGFS
jgi:hypothetical protein